MDEVELQPAKSRVNKWLVGCLGATLIFLALCVAGYFYIKSKAVEFIATEMHDQIVHEIDASALPDDQKQAFTAIADRLADDLRAGRISIFDKKSLAAAAQGATTEAISHLNLPDDQKAGLITQVNRVADGYREDKISDDQMGEIFDKLFNGPFGASMGAWGFEAAHVYGSGLSDEQKKDAAIQLRRVARGYAEGKISKSDLDPHWQKISIPDPDKPGERKMKEHLTDSEILAFIEDMRTEADKAGVPNELYKIDFATEMKKAVDEVMGE